jgi:membrane-bound serine protease (ClpP class)
MRAWGGQRRRVRRVTAMLVLGTWGALGAAALAQQGSGVLHSRIEGEVITPVISDFLGQGVARAEREGHVAYLIELDTPGGLDTSMREIVQSFLTARVPVIVYVPPGGRAASAGAIIGMSAHVLAMAPATSIGAATPVDLQGGDISTKIINDAASYAEDIARARGRDIVFARESVTRGRSVTSVEARALGVINLIAEDTTSLLEDLEGATVRLGDGERVQLRTRAASLVEHELGIFQRIRQRLADPNVAFILMSLGTLAIIYELANPGIGAGGVSGVILIVLALFGLSVLPVTTAGIVLLVLSAGLFVGEVLTPGIGIFGTGGVISLILAGLFLYEGSISVSLALLIPTAIVVGLLVIFAGRMAWRARRAPSATGTGQVIGQQATIKRVEGEAAQIFIEGAWWRVHADEPLAPGQRVFVVAADGVELRVRPVLEQSAVEEGE